MKADSLTIADVFKGGGDIQFVLPHFQREYSWEKEHWKALLDDACEIFEEGDGVTERLVKLEHFLGSLVGYPGRICCRGSCQFSSWSMANSGSLQ